MTHFRLPDDAREILAATRDLPGPVVFLTGAGISAESGIPTFRGEEGFWRVGSANYRPEELATLRAFRRMPEEIWGWYLYRRAVCHQAFPNVAHRSLAALEPQLGDEFLLITQNVDGLHLRAGNSRDRTFQIHGNLDYVRCASECDGSLLTLTEPDVPGASALEDWPRDRTLEPDAREILTCRRCGGWLRPHVLWFDECYDEERYRVESSLLAAETCRLLVVVGTSGATSLPMQVASTVASRGAALLVIDPSESPFSRMAEAGTRGCFLPLTAGKAIPTLIEELARGRG